MIAKRERRKRQQPLEVDLTVVMNLGDRPEHAVTLVDDRRVPLVGSVFENRDRIARGFWRLLVRSGLQRPEVMQRMLPRRLFRKK